MLRPFTRFGVRGAEKKLTQINEHHAIDTFKHCLEKGEITNHM